MVRYTKPEGSDDSEYLAWVETAVSGVDDALVTDAGLAAGSTAAVQFLQRTMARLGAEAILVALPRIHADVVASTREPTFGPFGYYAGVTRVAVALQSAFEREGLNGVVGWLEAPPFGRQRHSVARPWQQWGAASTFRWLPDGLDA